MASASDLRHRDATLLFHLVRIPTRTWRTNCVAGWRHTLELMGVRVFERGGYGWRAW